MHVKVQWVRGITVGFVLAVLGAGEAWAGTTYYAAPAGSGTACTQGAPCAIATALAKPAEGAGDVVHLGPGTYTAASLTLNVSDATIQGSPGARPILDVDGLFVHGDRDRVSDIDVDSAAAASNTFVLNGAGAVGERIAVR